MVSFALSQEQSSGSSGGSGDGGASTGAQQQQHYAWPVMPTRERAAIAHGVFMSLAAVLVFPTGGIIIRLPLGRHTVHIHAALQVFGLLLIITGLGLGLYVVLNPVSFIDNYHPVIGLVVIGFWLLQPLSGVWHHLLFRTVKKRTIPGYVHAWLGRAVLTLGMINGGLGLKICRDDTRSEQIAYGVLAGIIWCVWMGVSVWSEVKRARGGGAKQESSLTDSAERLEMEKGTSR
ncbi:MAG: hypothetical protein Q9220_001008 [cf. Caloplaca sp. 1 TL-2023]